MHYVTNREDAVTFKGGKPKQNYLLHPDAFKKCLIRSLKTDKYADYYILLEKCIKCYNEYQLIEYAIQNEQYMC